MILAFEHAFDVMIPDIALENIVTVQDAVDYIKQQKKPRRSDMRVS
jgi:acyl carrier protein